MNNEPVAWMRQDGTLKFKEGLYFEVGQAFYTNPVKELTDDEIWEVLKSVDADTQRLPQGFKLFAKAILRKAQEK
jgi:hypothetical protein